VWLACSTILPLQIELSRTSLRVLSLDGIWFARHSSRPRTPESEHA
jgi:hypothetical protein